MKKLLIFLFLNALILCLSACGCEHSWIEATCESPKICSLCGETEGEISGHDWTESTCISPKTCSLCGKSEGGLSEHTWKNAVFAKSCDICGIVEGKTVNGINYSKDAFLNSKTYKSIEEILGKNFTKYDYILDTNEPKAIFQIEDTAAKGVAEDIIKSPDSWNSLLDVMCRVSNKINSILSIDGYDITVRIIYYDDRNPDNILCIIENGTVKYNFLNK